MITFQDEEGIRAAIASVRKDGSGIDWCVASLHPIPPHQRNTTAVPVFLMDPRRMLTGYQPSLTTLELVGSGSGGLSSLKSHLKVDNVFYGLLRLTEKIDDRLAFHCLSSFFFFFVNFSFALIDSSVTTKFVFVIFIGEKVPGVKKARIATHKGAVLELFGVSNDCLFFFSLSND